MYNHYNYNNNIPIIMSYNTPYESVREFHEVFEHPTNDTPQTTIFDDKPDLVKLRIALIDEEFNEFKEACHNKDMTESLDALADMMYVIAGAAHAFGVNLDEAFARVHQSHLINTRCIKEFIKGDGGYLVLTDGSNVPVSIRKRNYVMEVLNNL